MSWFAGNPAGAPPWYPPPPPPLPPAANSGRFMTVNSYQEVEAAQIPADGSKALFLLANAPVLYLASMENGQKMIAGFSITPLVGEQAKPKKTLESRVADIEMLLQQLAGGVANGKSPGGNDAGQQAAARQPDGATA